MKRLSELECGVRVQTECEEVSCRLLEPRQTEKDIEDNTDLVWSVENWVE